MKREVALQKITALILHRTTGPNYKGYASSAKIINKKIAGAHFYVDKDGSVYQTVSLKYVTIHLYDKKGQMYDEYLGLFKNTNTIGIEVVGQCLDQVGGIWEDLTSQQIQSVALLVKQIKEEYNLKNNDIYPHEKVQRKTKGEGQVVWETIKDKID